MQYGTNYNSDTVVKSIVLHVNNFYRNEKKLHTQ